MTRRDAVREGRVKRRFGQRRGRMMRRRMLLRPLRLSERRVVVPTLVSVAQVARRLGISHQMASKMTRRRRDLFPTVVEVGDAAAGDRVVRLFLASELEAAAAVERRPGRPRREGEQ